MADLDPIIQALAAARRAQGLSQRAVGRYLGTSSYSVNSWERGLRDPVLANVTAWAQALGYNLTLEPDE